MKQSFGAKPARSCSLSMHWVAANHKKEGAVSVSVGGKTCRPMAATTIELPDPAIYAIDAELGRGGRAIVTPAIPLRHFLARWPVRQPNDAP